MTRAKPKPSIPSRETASKSRKEQPAPAKVTPVKAPPVKGGKAVATVTAPAPGKSSLPKAAPKIVVIVRALVSRTQDRALVGDKTFTAEVRASENRVGAIVPAFNQALTQVLTEMVAWTNAADEKSNLPG